MWRRARASGSDLPAILVADGDTTAGRLLVDHLVRGGFRAAHTPRGDEVLKEAAAGRVSLAIVDVALDDMSGHTLVARLKEVDPALRVLMTTADYRPELELRARQIGILHYALKPVDATRLAAVVARAVIARPRSA